MQWIEAMHDTISQICREKLRQVSIMYIFTIPLVQQKQCDTYLSTFIVFLFLQIVGGLIPGGINRSEATEALIILFVFV